jgi:hypothetical protein
MKTFYIHANKVAVSESRGHKKTFHADAEKFKTERELARLAAQWPASRLHEIWNTLPGTRPVRKFTDRKTAVHRIWIEIQKLNPSPKSATKRAGTKAEQIIALLRQPSGATLNSIIMATGWQAHSVRGFVSGHLVKKMGLPVKSFRRDGERVYAINS